MDTKYIDNDESHGMSEDFIEHPCIPSQNETDRDKIIQGGDNIHLDDLVFLQAIDNHIQSSDETRVQSNWFGNSKGLNDSDDESNGSKKNVINSLAFASSQMQKEEFSGKVPEVAINDNIPAQERKKNCFRRKITELFSKILKEMENIIDEFLTDSDSEITPETSSPQTVAPVHVTRVSEPEMVIIEDVPSSSTHATSRQSKFGNTLLTDNKFNQFQVQRKRSAQNGRECVPRKMRMSVPKSTNTVLLQNNNIIVIDSDSEEDNLFDIPVCDSKEIAYNHNFKYDMRDNFENKKSPISHNPETQSPDKRRNNDQITIDLSSEEDNGLLIPFCTDAKYNDNFENEASPSSQNPETQTQDRLTNDSNENIGLMT